MLKSPFLRLGRSGKRTALTQTFHTPDVFGEEAEPAQVSAVSKGRPRGAVDNFVEPEYQSDKIMTNKTDMEYTSHIFIPPQMLITPNLTLP